MYWLIDESKSFIYSEVPTRQWKLAVVAGVALPYKGYHKWKRINRRLRHGPDYKSKDEQKIHAILDDMIACGVEAVAVVGDIGYASLADAEKLRSNLLDPIYPFADKEPESLRQALRHHLDNLFGKGEHKFSLQEFFKVWSILESIVALMQLYMQNLGKMKAIDLRKLKIIIDDQCKGSLKTLKEFVYFFIYCRSQDGRFSCPPGTMKRLRAYNLRTENGVTRFDAVELINDICVEEHGANMDKKYPMLQIPDLIGNFLRRVLQGELHYSLAAKLHKILKICLRMQATSQSELIVNVPQKAQNAVGLLFPF